MTRLQTTHFAVLPSLLRGRGGVLQQWSSPDVFGAVHCWHTPGAILQRCASRWHALPLRCCTNCCLNRPSKRGRR